MKRGTLLLILLPMVLAECITYEDCTIKCEGSARVCAEGVCIATGCIPTKTESSIDKITDIAIKSILVIGSIILAALLLPLMKLNAKARFVVVSVLILCIGLFAAYLFKGSDIGFLQGEWDSEPADALIRKTTKDYDLEEKLITPAMPLADNGKSYRLNDPLHENVVVAMEISEEYDIKSLSDGFSVDKIGNAEIYIEEDKFFDRIMWRQDEFVFIVAGDEALAVSRLMLGESGTVALMGVAPKITITAPNTTTRSTEVVLEITDEDSRINISSLKGVDSTYCSSKNQVYSCKYNAEFTQGKNTLSFSVLDYEKNTATASKNIVYDTKPWDLEVHFPKQEYVNTAMVHFIVSDITGIEDFSYSGISKHDCKLLDNGYECKLENLNLSQGRITVAISAADGAGNSKQDNFSFIYDSLRPEIEITNKGFIITEPNLEDSVMIDRKKYSLESCNSISGELHCSYTGWISEIIISDKAGNSIRKEQKLQR